MKVKIVCADQLFRTIYVTPGTTLVAALRQAGFAPDRYTCHINGMQADQCAVLHADTVVELTIANGASAMPNGHASGWRTKAG